jgi:ABC-type glycerol-3-phosphate transport system substrate-binding protein
MNRAQIIIFGFIVVVVILALLVVTGIIPGLKKSPPPPFTLTIWGTTDEPAFWLSIASNYRQNSIETASIVYVKKSQATYEEELVNALASGMGPDIFLLPDTWIEKHLDKVSPLPDGTLGYQKKNLKSIFADHLAEAIITSKNELIGVPLAFDTLGLFFNRDYFNAATIPNPPQTWDELTEDAEKLTKLSDIGTIQRSGVALGTAANVEHAADILVALLFQSGGGVVSVDTTRSTLTDPKVNSALAFYTAFSNVTKKTYSWNLIFENSLDAFAQGKTAMAFGYASDIKRIVAINPQLNFDASKFPQLDLKNRQVNFGRFSLLTVSRTSKQSNQAWTFLLWLEGRDFQKDYIDRSGLPPARRDLVTSAPPRDYLAPFYDQVLSAEVFPPMIANSITPLINDMIDSVVNHRFTITESIQRASSQLNAILDERNRE